MIAKMEDYIAARNEKKVFETSYAYSDPTRVVPAEEVEYRARIMNMNKHQTELYTTAAQRAGKVIEGMSQKQMRTSIISMIPSATAVVVSIERAPMFYPQPIDMGLEEIKTVDMLAWSDDDDDYAADLLVTDIPLGGTLLLLHGWVNSAFTQTVNISNRSDHGCSVQVKSEGFWQINPSRIFLFR